MSNKDMQFQEMRREIKIEIANTFGFPLQLLLDSTMTYNNLSTAMAQYYDNAVLPVFKDIIGQLNKHFLTLFSDAENLEFSYNELDIPALRYRAIEQAQAKVNVGVNTTNEIRTMFDEDPVAGGDEIITPTSNTTLSNIESDIKAKYIKNEK